MAKKKLLSYENQKSHGRKGFQNSVFSNFVQFSSTSKYWKLLLTCSPLQKHFLPMVENFSAIDGKLFYHWWKTMSTVFHHQWWKTIDTVFHHWQKTIEIVFHHWQKMILQWRTCLGHRSVLSESPRPTESKWAQQKLCTNRSMTTILGYDSQSKCALFSMLIGTFYFPSSV